MSPPAAAGLPAPLRCAPPPIREEETAQQRWARPREIPSMTDRSRSQSERAVRVIMRTGGTAGCNGGRWGCAWCGLRALLVIALGGSEGCWVPAFLHLRGFFVRGEAGPRPSALQVACSETKWLLAAFLKAGAGLCCGPGRSWGRGSAAEPGLPLSVRPTLSFLSQARENSPLSLITEE